MRAEGLDNPRLDLGADLQMVQRYTKLLPQPDERDPADRLNAYLRSRKAS